MVDLDCPTVTVTLSLPDKGLSPNARTYRKKKAELIIVAREAAYYVCLAEVSRSGWPFQHATARETYYWPVKRRRDTRNAESRTKALWDGIVKSGMIVDDDYEHLVHLPSVFELDRKNPRLVIDIWDTTKG